MIPFLIPSASTLPSCHRWSLHKDLPLPSLPGSPSPTILLLRCKFTALTVTPRSTTNKTVVRMYRSLGTPHGLTFQARLLHNQEHVQTPNDRSKESSRRDLSKTALFGIGTLLVVEQSSLERQSRGRCAKTPILTEYLSYSYSRCLSLPFLCYNGTRNKINPPNYTELRGYSVQEKRCYRRQTRHTVGRITGSSK